MKKKEVKNEIATEFIKTLGDIEGMTEIEKMVKDNKIPFDIDGIKYRVRQPSFEEQKELEKHRRTKYIEFMNDDSMMFQKQWIEKYKAKGIDINAMEKKIREKEKEKNQLKIKLAQTSEEKRVDELKKEILALRGEQAELNIEKTDLMSFSIEDQLMLEVNSYYTYLVLEKLVEVKDKGNQWIRVYKDYDEFSKSKNSTLLHKAFTYVNHLIYTLGV
jgi:hypothetical protein